VITTGCGFLVLNQQNLAARLKVPGCHQRAVVDSNSHEAVAPGKRLGVLTFSGRDLTPAHFVAAGANPDTPVEGVTQDGVFQSAIYEQPCDDSVAAREAEVVAAAERLIARHSDIGAILFRVHQLPAASRRSCGSDRAPIYDVFTLIGITARERAILKLSFRVITYVNGPVSLPKRYRCPLRT